MIPTSRRTAMDHPLFRPESNIAARASCPLLGRRHIPADKTGYGPNNTGQAARLALQLELCLPRLLSSPAPEGSFDGLRAFSRNPGRRARPTSLLPFPLQRAEPSIRRSRGPIMAQPMSDATNEPLGKVGGVKSAEWRKWINLEGLRVRIASDELHAGVRPVRIAASRSCRRLINSGPNASFFTSSNQSFGHVLLDVSRKLSSYSPIESSYCSLAKLPSGTYSTLIADATR